MGHLFEQFRVDYSELNCENAIRILHGDWYITFLHIYTGCPKRKGPNFGRVFLRSNYTDITQNTYIQIWMVTEILAREKCGLLLCLRNVLCPWRHPLDLQRDNPAVAAFLRYRKMQLTATTLATLQMFGLYGGWKSVDNYDTCASVFVVLFNCFMSLKSYFDVMYWY